MYFKKAGGMCLPNTVVPKKQKEGVGIVKTKQVADAANKFVKIMAQLQGRKKAKLSIEALKELEESRGFGFGHHKGSLATSTISHKNTYFSPKARRL